MATNGKPKVGIFGLTGCAGDQLQILNCEDHLLWLARRLDLVDWVMVKSSNDNTCRLDIAFVEGVVATERDLADLKKIRARTNVLVAMGTCAVWGGLPTMRNDLPRDVLQREVYHDDARFLDTVEARPCDPLCPLRATPARMPDRAGRVPQHGQLPAHRERYRSYRGCRCAGSARRARTCAGWSTSTRSAAAP